MKKVRKYLSHGNGETFAKKLAAYSAAITGAMAFTGQTHAQVVFTPQDSATIYETLTHVDDDNYLYIDFDNDGIVDVSINVVEYSFSIGEIYVNLPGVNSVEGDNSFRKDYFGYTNSYPTPYALNSGDTIGKSNMPFLDSTFQIMGLITNDDTIGNWLNANDKYLGVKFLDSAKQMHYGWLRLSTYITPDSEALTIIQGYAYESTPNRPIIAGDTAGTFTGIYATITGNTNICIGTGTRLTVNTFGGHGPFTYSWSPATGLSDTSVVNPVASPNVKTTYSVLVTDSAGKTFIASTTINLVPLSITAQVNPDSCGAGTGNANALANNGNPPFKYLWSTSDTLAFVQNLKSGSYNVTVIDSGGCTGNIAVVIPTVCDSVVISGNTQTCPGVNTQLTATVIDGSGNYLFNWSPSTGLSDKTIANPVASPSITTTYAVTVTDISNGNLSVARITIYVAPFDVYAFSFPADSCGVSDGAAEVCTNNINQGTYIWSNGDTNANIANLAPGRYDVTVTEANGCVGIASVLVTNPCDSVWPGDANDDGIVNWDDVFQVWYDEGDNGPLRPNESIQWVGQPATPWLESFWWDFGVNAKFTDCNGDGVIDDSDLNAVNQNYTLTHNKTGPANRALPTDPVLTLVPESDTILPNSTFKVKIMLGSANKPVDSLFALAFQINFDPAIFDTANAQLNINSSWMGTGGVNLSSFKKILTASGQVIIAMGRTDRQNVGGNGEIGELVMTTKTNIPAQAGNNIVLTPEILRGTTLFGKPLTFNTQAAQVTVATGINELSIDNNVNIYPNPTNGKFLLSINQPSKQLTIELLNIQGQQLYLEQLKDQQSLNKEFDFSYLAKGVYLLKVSTENGVAVKRVVLE